MSSIIGVEGSGGVDLNSLTTGELLFISWLKSRVLITRSYQPDTSTYYIGGYNSTYAYLDFSTIDSFVVRSSSPTDNTIMDLEIYDVNAGAYAGSAENIIGNTTIDMSGKVRSKCYMTMLSFGSRSYLVLTQFTTTDGKVHTASNLNY